MATELINRNQEEEKLEERADPQGSATPTSGIDEKTDAEAGADTPMFQRLGRLDPPVPGRVAAMALWTEAEATGVGLSPRLADVRIAMAIGDAVVIAAPDGDDGSSRIVAKFTGQGPARFLLACPTPSDTEPSDSSDAATGAGGNQGGHAVWSFHANGALVRSACGRGQGAGWRSEVIAEFAPGNGVLAAYPSVSTALPPADSGAAGEALLVGGSDGTLGFLKWSERRGEGSWTAIPLEGVGDEVPMHAVTAIACDDDGRRVAVAFGHDIRIVPAAPPSLEHSRGEQPAAATQPAMLQVPAEVRALSFARSDECEFVVAAAADGCIRLIDLAKGQVVDERVSEVRALYAVQKCSTGRSVGTSRTQPLVVTASQGGAIREWSVSLDTLSLSASDLSIGSDEAWATALAIDASSRLAGIAMWAGGIHIYQACN